MDALQSAKAVVASFATSSNNYVARATKDDRAMNKSSINQHVVAAEYAVRGAIPLRAEELRVELHEGKKDGKDFDEVVSCNIGNPQQVGQKPLTFLRQLAALTEYPDLIHSPEASKIFPPDVLKRAERIVHEIGSTGAYSHSMGVPEIRKRVAKFISERDGHPAHANKIFLTAGASVGVANFFTVLLSSPNDGVLIPIPQYPLYTAALALNNAKAVPYYLNEDDDWSLDVGSLKETVKRAREEGTNLKAMVVINPGNPTGNTLSKDNMVEIAQFCYDEKLVLMADEVYQDNIYHSDRPFNSFKKIVCELPKDAAENLELVSFHSISKGQTGECGRRGGYYEIHNILPEVEEQLYKVASIQLCSPLGGQIAVDVLIDPPKQGEESYELWEAERGEIRDALKSRSEILVKAFRELEGVSCNAAQGAMYLFPSITLPPKAIDAAKEKNMAPDAFYSLQLLEATGICVVPGSGFGQKPGTWHFRTTFLPPGVEEFKERLKGFHEGFMAKYKD